MTQIETAPLRIIKYPDPVLRDVCKPVEDFDDSLARLAEQMLELMHKGRGIGLAAPQAGVLLRMFVCNVTGDPNDDHVYVNPSLDDFHGRAEGEEGCLSLPEVTVKIHRPISCTLHACDLTGRPVECTASELLARCWQHECDHLDGHLILDYMSETDKIANRRVVKQLESEYKSHGAVSRQR
ncbi:MAG: peptide deformylase [Phycisphaerae bacterium]|nr:peptide deformylase [Phycisphaerae bacterium]